jgi:hypothetical protein
VGVTFVLPGGDAGVQGVNLMPTSTTTLKGTGFAETQLTVPARVASVIVVATAGNRSVSSPAISFAGAVPNGRQLTFQCGSLAGEASGGAHAIGAYDSARNLIAGVKLNCFAHVGDRNGDGLSGALVSFMTEAGTIGPSSTSQTDVVGNAQVLYKTSLPVPAPTNPADPSDTTGPPGFTWNVPMTSLTNTGEYLVPLWMHPWEWNDRPYFNAQGALPVPNLREPRRDDPIRRCPTMPCKNNPRDNLVSMIAVTSGEEGFSDDDNNGIWNVDKMGVPEPFDDLTEPFVDNNDNATWDPGERYIDSNGNGAWDGKNSRWDANTLIWKQERILWTGLPDRIDMGDTTDPVAKQLLPASALAVKFLETFPNPVNVMVSDPWYNSIAQNGEGDGCQLGGAADEPLVLAVPKTFGIGRAFTYPAFRVYSFHIRDARDPTPSSADGGFAVPLRNPPIPFVVPIICRFTASPIEGYVTQLELAPIVGTVE